VFWNVLFAIGGNSHFRQQQEVCFKQTVTQNGSFFSFSSWRLLNVYLSDRFASGRCIVQPFIGL